MTSMVLDPSWQIGSDQVQIGNASLTITRFSVDPTSRSRRGPGGTGRTAARPRRRSFVASPPRLRR